MYKEDFAILLYREIINRPAHSMLAIFVSVYRHGNHAITSFHDPANLGFIILAEYNVYVYIYIYIFIQALIFFPWLMYL